MHNRAADPRRLAHAREPSPACDTLAPLLRATGMSAERDPSVDQSQQQSKSRSQDAAPPKTPRAAPEPAPGSGGGGGHFGRDRVGEHNPRDTGDRDHTQD